MAREDLVHIMIQEVGVDMAATCVPWVEASLDYEPLFSILDGPRLDGEWCYWVEHREAVGNICGAEVNTGQMSAGVKIAFPVSHNTLTRAEEYT